MRTYDAAYWRALDERRAYPDDVRRAFTRSRLLAALIPPEYGGLGADLGDACAIVGEINRAGGNAGTAHAQMYTMGTCCATAPRPSAAPGCRASPRARCGCRRSA